MNTETQTAGPSATTETAAPAATENTLLTATPAADPAAAPTQTDQPTQAEPAAQTGEAKPAEGQEADPAAQAAPEEYAEFAAPEGMTFNTEALAEFKALAKEKGLSQEDAQKFTDMGAKLVQKVEDGYRTKIEQAQAQWADDARADKEFGGDNLQANMAVAKKALDTFGTPELTKLFNESGLGNHPEFIRAFYRVGKAISEDRLVAGSTRPEGVEDVAKKMFPSMKN